MIRRALLALVIPALLALAAPAGAHEFRPAIIDIEDLGQGTYAITADPDLALSLPAPCRRVATEGIRATVDCGSSPLSVTARNLGERHGDALVRYAGPGGPATAVLQPAEPTFTAPTPAAPRPAAARMGGYFRAGIAHILGGADHLLFVLGLLLLVRGARPLIKTITAFTLAHSLTLALAVTAAVRLPPSPVEATIALSLVLLAGELCRGEGSPTLARRRPALLAFSFGLLHGFGFAGGLADLRVPAADLPLALGGFNLGVEAGQLLFVALALAATPLLRRALPPAARARLAPAPAYLIGTMGAFYCLDRLTQIWRS